MRQVAIRPNAISQDKLKWEINELCLRNTDLVLLYR